MDTVLKIKDKQQAALALIQLYRAIFRRRLVTFGGDFGSTSANWRLMMSKAVT